MKTEEIKQLPIISVIDRLWLKYFKKWSWEYWLYDGWEKTSWRWFNVNKNIASDFSKDRASWDTFWFVKSYLSMDDKQTFNWFAENFQIEDKMPIRIFWNRLDTLWEKQISYLKSRGIKYDLVSDLVRACEWWIACLIHDKNAPRWINIRLATNDSNRRFFGVKWYPTAGVYRWDLEEWKPVIVVEWMMDFLTLRQFYKNTVWLKSAESGIDEIREISRAHEIVFVPDADDAWEKSKSKFDFDYSLFDISDIWDYKDINEAHMKFMSPDIVNVILDECKKALPIDWSFEKFYAMQDIIKRQWKLWTDWPIEEIYKHTQWVIPGKVYTIGAFSNVGKSKFAYYHTKHFLEQNKSVLFINLEVGEDMCLWNIICSVEGVWYSDIAKWYKPNESKYSKLIIRDDLYKLEDIEECIKAYRSDIVFIDFVQNIDAPWSDYERHSNIARTIQRIAIETNSTIYSLSQVSNSVGKDVQNWNRDFVSMKWSWEYYASSDVIFVLRKWDEPNEIELKIQKNKFWYNGKEFVLWVDYNKNNFWNKDKSDWVVF